MSYDPRYPANLRDDSDHDRLIDRRFSKELEDLIEYEAEQLATDVEIHRYLIEEDKRRESLRRDYAEVSKHFNRR